MDISHSRAEQCKIVVNFFTFQAKIWGFQKIFSAFKRATMQEEKLKKLRKNSKINRNL
jgi:hypothetical protein